MDQQFQLLDFCDGLTHCPKHLLQFTRSAPILHTWGYSIVEFAQLCPLMLQERANLDLNDSLHSSSDDVNGAVAMGRVSPSINDTPGIIESDAMHQALLVYSSLYQDPEAHEILHRG
jgi:hypothetical protein